MTDENTPKLLIKVLCSSPSLKDAGESGRWLLSELDLLGNVEFEFRACLGELDANADIYVFHEFNWGVFDPLTFLRCVRERNEKAAFILLFEDGTRFAGLGNHCGVFRLRLFKSALNDILEEVRKWRAFREKWHYDVALSFRGSQRDKAEILYAKLKSLGLRTFYDRDFEWTIWGQQGTLSRRYREARHVIIFYSDDYLTSGHTKAELQESLLSHKFTPSTILGIQTRDGGKIPEALSKWLYFREWKSGAESLARGFLKKLETSIYEVERPTGHYEYDLYVSYKRGDQTLVYQLIEELKKRGVKIFSDQLVRPGEDFDLHLKIGFNKSKDFLFLAGQGTPDEGFQQKEFSWAKERLKIAADHFFILPILLPAADPELIEDLVGGIRYELLPDESEAEMAKLVEAVFKRVGCSVGSEDARTT